MLPKLHFSKLLTYFSNFSPVMIVNSKSVPSDYFSLQIESQVQTRERQGGEGVLTSTPLCQKKEKPCGFSRTKINDGVHQVFNASNLAFHPRFTAFIVARSPNIWKESLDIIFFCKMHSRERWKSISQHLLKTKL